MTEPRRPLTPDEEVIRAEELRVVSELTDEQRVARMADELRRGFAALTHVSPAASVFGSARTAIDHPEYHRSVELGRKLGEAGLAVITGGGPGAMEAANKGAREAQALSVGLTIDLPAEERVNRYVDLEVHFHYFFCRKVMFVRYASAYLALPGGFGTLDELFECLTLIQTQKIKDFPVILIGSDHWGGLVRWMRDELLGFHRISEQDLDRVLLTDDLDEAVERVLAAVARQQIAELG
ncbi:MAG: TIGR00730 family Rossman fold protein [Solirubrobacteraceae bacterium]|nr:TIGR00730 family Rossman fold protein [Solirubrobacteraceae bacterium]